MLLRCRARSRCRAFSRCFAGLAVCAAASRRSSSLWIRLGSSSRRTTSVHTTWSRRSCRTGRLLHTGRRGVAKRRSRGIGSSGCCAHSTGSICATAHSRICCRTPSPARCWARSSAAAQASCFAPAALGLERRYRPRRSLEPRSRSNWHKAVRGGRCRANRYRRAGGVGA